MESNIVVALVVVVVVAAHVAIFRWVKFKIDEGVILKFLREAGQGGARVYQHTDEIAGQAALSAKRVAVVCRKSAEIEADPETGSHWRAGSVSTLSR